MSNRQIGTCTWTRVLDLFVGGLLILAGLVWVDGWMGTALLLLGLSGVIGYIRHVSLTTSLIGLMSVPRD